MRKYAVALTFLLVVSGCSGSSDTATPATTVAPLVTQAPTTTVVPTTTATPTTQAPATTVAGSAELAAVCTFDESVPKISCHAVGFAQSDQLRWESNVYGHSQGTSYEVELVEQYQLVPEVTVTLQECQGSDCESVTTTIDTSAIAQGVPDSSASTTAPTTTVVSGDTVVAPAELAAVCTFDESVPKISCEAVGTSQGSQLRWESNVYGWLTGTSYEVELVEQYQLVSEAIVTLQECQGSDCESVTTTIDTSAITQDVPDSSASTTAPTTTVVSDDTVVAPAELVAVCTFDESVPKISCQAIGATQGSHLRWESNVYGWKTGTSYEFQLVEQSQLVPEVIVNLQECQGSDCESVTTTIDTSAIAQTPSAIDETPSAIDETPSATDNPALLAKIESFTCLDQQITAGRKTTCRAVVSGEVDFVGWHLDDYMTIPWDRDQPETSLEDMLVQQLGFDQEGNHEVMIQACTGKPWGYDPKCVEESVAIVATERTAVDYVRQYACEGTGSQLLEVSPISPEQLDYIKPLGAMSGVHPTPVSHQYFYPMKDVVAEVRAPISGHIVELTNRGGGGFGGASGQDYEVRYTIEVSCDLYLYVDHVLEPPEEVRSAIDQGQRYTRIPVSAGDLLGLHADGFKVDLSVVDLSRGEVDGFVLNNSYFDGPYGESFKLFERDSFEYFEEPLRTQLAEKSLRTVEPRGGKFTYDVDGTAQGNWFREGTNGYVGGYDNLPLTYPWVGHLAMTPLNIDPSKLRVAIGDGFTGGEMASVWGVTGHSPPFDSVTPLRGLTRYEVRQLLPCDGSSPHIRGRAREITCNAAAMGTLIVELLNNRTMRVEVAFGVAPSSSPTFTGNARIYVR